MPEIPITAGDLGYNFEANASPAPGAGRHGLLADPAAGDPGHLAEPDEWAAIVAQAEGQS